ncbi:hypothetical protein BGX29_005281, partial [Mortierella sp. GBA35]
ERMMMSVFIEAFKTRRLADWSIEPVVFARCQVLEGDAAIVGRDEQGLLRGITEEHISMEEFMDAHVNHGSMRDGFAVPPFFFPSAGLAGLDIVFYVQVNRQLFPVFVQLKLRPIPVKKDDEQLDYTVVKKDMTDLS